MHKIFILFYFIHKLILLCCIIIHKGLSKEGPWNKIPNLQLVFKVSDGT